MPAPTVAFSCSYNPIEQFITVKYFGLHQSGAVVHLISPIKSRLVSDGILCCSVAGPSTCIYIIAGCLTSLQAVLVPGLHCEYQVWGKRSPREAAANCICLDLQPLHDYILRTICSLLPSNPSEDTADRLGSGVVAAEFVMLELLDCAACRLLLPYGWLGHSY